MMSPLMLKTGPKVPVEALESITGNFLTTCLMADSSVLSDKKAGLDFASEQAFLML